MTIRVSSRYIGDLENVPALDVKAVALADGLSPPVGDLGVLDDYSSHVLAGSFGELENAVWDDSTDPATLSADDTLVTWTTPTDAVSIVLFYDDGPALDVDKEVIFAYLAPVTFGDDQDSVTLEWPGGVIFKVREDTTDGVTLSEDSTGIFDPDTSDDVIDEWGTLVGLDGGTISGLQGFVSGTVLTEPGTDLEVVLQNASALSALLLAQGSLTSATVNTTIGDTLAAALTAEAAARSDALDHTAPYLHVCGDNGDLGAVECDTDLGSFPDGYDMRIRVLYEGGEDPNTYLEIGTRTADGGTGAIDAPEAALWINDDGQVTVFGESTDTVGVAEAGTSGRAGAAGIIMDVRVTQDTATQTLKTWIALDSGPTVTADDTHWHELASITDAKLDAVYDSPDPWQIGRGGSGGAPRVRVMAWSIRDAVDGTIVSELDITGAANGATVVEDTTLESSPGTPAEWSRTAGGFAVVVVPSAGGGSGDLVSTNNLSDVANAGTARSNLGLAIGTNVQAFDADLSAVAGLSPSNDDLLQRKAGAWTNRTPAQVKTDLAIAAADVSGLGGAATLNVGTATSTVAAGDDARFADLLALVNPSGTVAASHHRAQTFANTNAALTSGRLQLYAVGVRAGVTINSITFYSGSTAAVSPTNHWFGLFDSSRSCLRLTADATTAAWNANTAKTLNLTSGYTPSSSGMVYVGIMVAASTVPSLLTTSDGGLGIYAATPILAGRADTGLTTPPSLPFTAAALTAITTTPYFTLNS